MTFHTRPVGGLGSWGAIFHGHGVGIEIHESPVLRPESEDVLAVGNVVTRRMAGDRIPGGAGVLVQDGRVVYQQGYGEAAPGRPVTPQTQFYGGSLTKSFTALAALPIELRLAGLDRDLGWLPAAGCALRYRFDAEGDR